MLGMLSQGDIFMSVTLHPAEVQNYRKLSMFSGVKRTPCGEEDYDARIQHTTHMLDE